MNPTQDINTLGMFLAERDVPELSINALKEPVDVLVLLGSSLVGPVYTAAKAMQDGVAKHLLISGGVGHSTDDLRENVAGQAELEDVVTDGRAEADIFHEILTSKLGVDPARIIIENQSTNCGTNAELSRKVLDEMGVPLRRIVLLQDPTMQRRSQACFERAWKDKPEVEIISFAPFIPHVQETNHQFEVSGDGQQIWPFDRFLSLILGEIPRLRDDVNGYGPKGRNYFGHVEIPQNVLEAYKNTAARFAHALREIPS
jgi:uncharacterized SAM-binding protein YcdF (DUF218 family)